jgi:hypothetical protein
MGPKRLDGGRAVFGRIIPSSVLVLRLTGAQRAGLSHETRQRGGRMALAARSGALVRDRVMRPPRRGFVTFQVTFCSAVGANHGSGAKM